MACVTRCCRTSPSAPDTRRITRWSSSSSTTSEIPKNGRATPSPTIPAASHGVVRSGSPTPRCRHRGRAARPAPPPHPRPGDARRDHRQAREGRDDDVGAAQRSPLVQPDPHRDHLGQRRVVLEAVRRDHVTPVAVDVHRALVGRGVERVPDHREHRVVVAGDRDRQRVPQSRPRRRPRRPCPPSRRCASSRPRRPRRRDLLVLLRPGELVPVAVRQGLVEGRGRVGDRTRVGAPERRPPLAGEPLGLLAPEPGPRQTGHEQEQQPGADERADEAVSVPEPRSGTTAGRPPADGHATRARTGSSRWPPSRSPSTPPAR